MGIARNKNEGSCVTVFKNLESKANVTIGSIQEHEGLKPFHGQVNRKSLCWDIYCMLSPAQQTYLKQAKNPHMISCRRIGHLDESFGPPFVNHVFFDRENGWIRSLFHRRALNIPRRSGGLVALSVEVFDGFFRLLQPKLLCSTHDKIREGMIRLDEKLIEERGSLGEFSGRGGQIYLSRHTSRNWNRGTIGPLPWASILGSNCGGREMLSRRLWEL
jgi:hypothetical protein